MTRIIGAALAALFILATNPAAAQSPNLDCDHIPSNPTQGEVTANAATDCLDEATQNTKSWTITGNETVTQSELAEGFLHVLGGTPGSAFDFDLPSGVARTFAVHNDSGDTATVQVVGGGGDSVAVGDDNTVGLHTDGTDVIALSVGADSILDDIADVDATSPNDLDLLVFDSGDSEWTATAPPPFTIGVFLGGTQSNDQLLVKYVFAESVTCPQDLTGSQGHAGTTATGNTDIDLQKNGSSVGTISFAMGASTATFTHASDTSFAAGDRVSMVAPASADATLADVSITLNCNRD